MKKELKQKLEKKAFGYYVQETSQDYALLDGKMTLVKEKITKKHIPLDITACKMLEDNDEEDLDKLSDEELKKRKIQLLNQLKENYED